MLSNARPCIVKALIATSKPCLIERRLFSYCAPAWQNNAGGNSRRSRPLLVQRHPRSESGLDLYLKRLPLFSHNHRIKRRAQSMGLRGELFDLLSEKFVSAVKAGKVPNCNRHTILSAYNEEEGVDSVDRALLSAFYEYAEPQLPESVREGFRSLRKLSDLRFPSEWFPDARRMQRTIFLHVGPTNSGKTYRALQRLAGAESGIYCGPLRLLAHEIYDKMNDAGVPCSLLTGEEKRDVPNAVLTSSTVEMANLGKPLEVAVIDEIQMIGDPYRGWAWTQALLGLQAKEIHLCGEASAVPLVQKICESLSEKVVVNEYERLTPVEIMDTSLQNDWQKIQKGDCVAAFSRYDIFRIKRKIEKETNLKCAVAYGSLPPETRALQAKAFNDPENPLNVLVASDAVGMGLNLNIKRIVFSTVQKFDGQDVKFIAYPQLKQIAGRAGRFGTAYDSGQVTTMRPSDLSYVRDAMQSPVKYLELAGLQPTVDILELFALQMPNEPFSGLLQKFEDLASLDGNYFLCNFKDQKLIADHIETINLPLRDRYQFVTAPVQIRNINIMNLIHELAKIHSENKTCSLESIIELPNRLPSTTEELDKLESSHKAIMLYMWLSLRYPETLITDQEECLQTKRRCETLIDESLQKGIRFKERTRGKHTKTLKKN